MQTGIGFYGFADAFGYLIGIIQPGFGQYYRKFFPAIAEGQVDAAHRILDTLPHPAQHLVPRQVPVSIIVGFEQVYIHKYQGKGTPET
jgi:hypothetical protein